VTSPALKALMAACRKRIFRENEPVVPKTNHWGRPFPLRREANLSWRYHSRILKRLPAPIPDRELEKLDKFTTGVESPVPPKRTNIIQQPSAELDRSETRRVTGRFKRRMYQKLLSEIPVLEFENSRYKATWRDEKLRNLNDGSKFMDAFEGLDAQGRLIDPKSFHNT